MRRVLTWLVLATLCVQQFVCCAESCESCAATAEPQHESPCQHDGHDHAPPLPDGDGSSHHLCVATHLFYLKSGATPGIGGDTAYGLMAPHEVVRDVPQALHLSEAVARSVPPPAALRLRAALSVWLI